jgi:hypothetical protein
MRKPVPLAGSLTVVVLVAGCATILQAGPRAEPDRIAERGLSALERDDFQGAIPDLEWVSTHFPDRPSGRYALLALAAAELDPANPHRRPEVGAALLGEFMAREGNPRWTSPIARSLRRTVLELRDAEERVVAARQAASRSAQAAREAEERASDAAREAGQAEARRASLGSRVAQLEWELAQSRQQLAEMRDEIDRMRRTLGN